MAPSRKKGANKAAAAAAARKKWKVGDLVLAKVKGFPAWPAAVSEPEKWGYRADRKKVVVHFFGGDQIAFCNPVDVEEFTEEKKVSLLAKRHGKGSDFVQALNEIIDCFEKLKKPDQSGVNGTEETSITNGNNSEESLSKPDKGEAPVVTEKLPNAGATNDLTSLTEAAVAAAAEDALHDEEMQLEERSGMAYIEKPACTMYSTISKIDVPQSAQKRSSARRLRSSSRRGDASRLQKLMLPSMDSSRSSRRSGTNELHDRSLRRSRRIMKSPDDSEGHVVDSPAFVLNDSIEENDSEVMTVDSDTRSYNEGCSVDSGCKTVGTELLNEDNDGETELNDRLEFQNNTVINKKKRKHNRKRHCNDQVVAAKLVKVAPEAEVLKTEFVSPSNNDNLLERPGGGDEHLPLVKRARIRMGRPSPSGEAEDTLTCKENKNMVHHESPDIRSSGHLDCKVDALAKGENLISSLSQGSPSNKPQFWETRKNSLDGEAALPPSKRLHRALEAMSANVAEDCQRASSSPTMNILRNGHSTSFVECSEQSVEIESGSGPRKDNRNSDTQSSASEFCVGSDVQISDNNMNPIVVVSDSSKTSRNTDCSSPKLCKDSLEHAEGADPEGMKVPLLNELSAKIVAVLETDSPSFGKESTRLDFTTQDCTMSPTEHCKIESSEVNEAAKEPDPKTCQLNLDAISVEGISVGALNADTSIPTCSADDDGEGDETQKTKHLPLVENNQECQRSKFVEEARPVSMDFHLMSATHVKSLPRNHHRSLFPSNSISDHHLEDRTASLTQSSSSLTDGSDSIARTSPPISSMCNISLSDNINYLENSSSCSPDIQLHLGKAKVAVKTSSKGGESLSSFETAIRSLTRTKESIGRATRIAIDCAKFGFASKVVEILTHSLESESSSHKKVDLFFLVDSIAQSSRGMKGDGGIYPSAIQTLLPRLLLAAAPPGSSSHENHKQCLKVLRVWQERKIIPEPIIRHHIRELDALCGSYPTGGSRRAFRNERAFDDPIREMEGMVDEYGSNSSFQLPGFCMPPMLRDADVGSDSDGESFEAVTPEHDAENLGGEKTRVSALEKRSHILEDVDGELEMEDVAPCCEVDTTSTSNIVGTYHTQMSYHQSDNCYGVPLAPHQPKDVPIISATLPVSSPPPPPPPPHPPHLIPPSAFPPLVCDSDTKGRDKIKLYTTSQNSNRNVRESMVKQSILPRVEPTSLDSVHYRSRENKVYEAQVPRQMPECSNSTFSDRHTSHVSGRGNSFHPADGAFSKGFHLRPPHPSPSNQFSYVQEQRTQSQRDIPPPSHPNRFHTRDAENGNFYRDRERNKFSSRDNIGECWRPPLPSISGPCHNDGSRRGHPSMSYGGPPREPTLPNNGWNYPPRPMSHRHFNSHRPPSEGPISVENRGPNYWRPPR